MTTSSAYVSLSEVATVLNCDIETVNDLWRTNRLPKQLKRGTDSSPTEPFFVRSEIEGLKPFLNQVSTLNSAKQKTLKIKSELDSIRSRKTNDPMAIAKVQILNRELLAAQKELETISTPKPVVDRSAMLNKLADLRSNEEQARLDAQTNPYGEAFGRWSRLKNERQAIETQLGSGDDQQDSTARKAELVEAIELVSKSEEKSRREFENSGRDIHLSQYQRASKKLKQLRSELAAL